MLNEFSPSHETLDVRVIECAGSSFALREHDVIGVLAPDGAELLETAGGGLAMEMDERLRPLVSLSEAICLATRGDVGAQPVVVLRLEAQLFGLLVDRAGEPTRAIVHPTLDPASALSTFTHIVRLDDGRDVPVLGVARLALTARQPEPSTRLRRAA